MKVNETGLDGLYIIENNISKDSRGEFVKLYNFNDFKNEKISCDFKESYFSISKENVIRGLHFQMPPHDHSKLVSVIEGEVIDVVIDMRKNSKTYGKVFSIILNDIDHKSIFIPSGFAHGFKVISKSATLVYYVTSVYNQTSDAGIYYDSIGFDWNINDPILSNRDKSFVTFNDFTKLNPF